ncbi:hypothetical protein HGRIS_014652 [Hohenbuehelia grisea]|uniref:Uncharacterized protein n=1 Tax=Hohenbuehelia grisea TaxID=104357 RepID=A0ABR3JU62_9AGAR
MSLAPGIYLLKNRKTAFYVVPNKFVADTWTIGRNVILLESGTASETRWQFVSSG